MNPTRAVVAGVNSTIGRAVAAELGGRFDVVGIARRAPSDAPYPVWTSSFEDSDLERVALGIRADGVPVEIVLCCVGVLHDEVTWPEKRLADLDPRRLLHSFHVNTVIPGLLIKHLAPLLPRDRRSVFACLSAKLASIDDNRLGGWYGYRASKAALNMIVKTAAVELARTRRQTAVIAIHPGTTKSPLSAPFTSRTPADRLYPPELTARRLVSILESVGPEDSGFFFDWNGERLPW